ncbi:MULTISPECIES: transposase [Petrotoga]|uniref:transposase n=1 Tax=Petrotoga TaxID=28236 RepID=UPI00106508B3
MSGSLKGKHFSPQIKQALIKLIQETKWPVYKTCKVLKLNPNRYYRWLREKEVKKPLRAHSLLTEEKEAIVEFALEHPTISHRKLAYMMIRENVAYVSPSSVYRVLKENNLIRTHRIKKREITKRELKVTGPNQV